MCAFKEPLRKSVRFDIPNEVPSRATFAINARRAVLMERWKISANALQNRQNSQYQLPLVKSVQPFGFGEMNRFDWTNRSLMDRLVSLTSNGNKTGTQKEEASAKEEASENAMKNTDNPPVPPRTTSKEKFQGRSAHLSNHPKPKIRDGPQRVTQVITLIMVSFLIATMAIYVVKHRPLGTPPMFASTKYRKCQSLGETSNCIHESRLGATKQSILQLFHHLNRRAGVHHCDNSSFSPHLPLDEFTKIFKYGKKYVLSIIYLLDENPQWQMEFDDTFKDGKDLHFKLYEPQLPLFCKIIKNINILRNVGCIIAIVLFSIYFIYRVMVYYNFREKKTKDVVSFFIKVINLELRQNNISRGKSVVVEDLYKSLVPAKHRSRCLDAWNKAIGRLEKEPGRFRFGARNRNGRLVQTIALK